MPHLYNTALLIGAALSAIAALLHILGDRRRAARLPAMRRRRSLH